MTRDRVTGLISLVLGIGVFILTMPKSNMANDVGPRAFPFITSGILVLCGLITILKEQKPQKPFFKKGKEGIKRFLAIWGVMILYVLGMYLIGFPIPTVAILFVMCMMFGNDPEHNLKIGPVKAVVYAVIVTAVLYGLFSMILRLRLPVGILF